MSRRAPTARAAAETSTNRATQRPRETPVSRASWSASERPALDALDRLDLRREDGPHVGFGYGRHQCVGQQLARMELQIVLPTLLRRVPTLRLAVPLDELPFKHDTLAYGVYELPVTW